jgi:hypothetical protein
MSLRTIGRSRAAVKNGQNTAVAGFPSYSEAEAAFVELRNRGFDLRRMSIVCQDTQLDEYVTGQAGDGATPEAFGRFLLIAHGTQDEIASARLLLERANPWTAYFRG